MNRKFTFFFSLFLPRTILQTSKTGPFAEKGNYLYLYPGGTFIGLYIFLFYFIPTKQLPAYDNPLWLVTLNCLSKHYPLVCYSDLFFILN